MHNLLKRGRWFAGVAEGNGSAEAASEKADF